MEVECKVVANTTCKILWVQSLLKELAIILPYPPTLWYDNLATTYLSVNPIFHFQTKHIELDFYFLSVAAKTLTVLFVPSKDQVVDISQSLFQ